MPCILLSSSVQVREEPALEGLRPMKESDAPQVHKLIMSYLKNFKLHPDFTEEEIRHWLTPRENVVHVYVRQHKGKWLLKERKITDLTSFYELPSSVIGHPKHKEVKAAYSFYNVATSVSLKELMQDALCLAKQKDFDVFNALDVMENKTLFEDLKFGVGDGFLRYYLYNWRFSTVTLDWCFSELRELMLGSSLPSAYDAYSLPFGLCRLTQARCEQLC
ncbi:hypothetical protein Esti_001670 [Eimeria stiedai]